jgi:FixJ family two-component response regulator
MERLLQQYEYKPVLFSSAEAFKNHTDFDKVVCIVLDINLNGGSGIELRYRLKADGMFVVVIYMTSNTDPPFAMLRWPRGAWRFKQGHSHFRSYWSSSIEFITSVEALDGWPTLVLGF